MCFLLWTMKLHVWAWLSSCFFNHILLCEYLVVSVSDTHFLKVEVIVTLNQIGKTFFLICWWLKWLQNIFQVCTFLYSTRMQHISSYTKQEMLQHNIFFQRKHISSSGPGRMLDRRKQKIIIIKESVAI